MTNEEEWRPIEGYSDYFVSNTGKVKSVKYSFKRETILKGFPNAKGYLRVELCSNGKSIKKFIHHLVANAFIENVDSKKTIDHINNDKLNNNAYNLRWASDSENNLNRSKTKSKTTSKYVGVSLNKKTSKWVSSICVNKKVFHLGYFNNEDDAAKKRNEFITKNNMEFCILNKIDNIV